MKKFGIVGLGRMGGGLAEQALEKGYEVAGYDLHGAPENLISAGLDDAESLADLVAKLPAPRFILVYVHAGEVLSGVVDGLVPHLQPGDIIGDGGNSYWGDSIRRAKALEHSGIVFMDIGTSGGVDGARHGACFMVGGPPECGKMVEPLLRDLAVPNGYVYAGPAGAGHFVKLVHNGIEFGMLQAIGEGVQLLNGYHEDLPITDVLKCWCNGSVIRSWLVELMHDHFANRGTVEDVPDYVEDTGEVNWLVADAMRMEIPTPVITQSVVQLFASRDKNRDWARAVAAMRHGFGGHPFGPDEAVEKGRQDSRLGDIFQPERDL